MENKEEYKMENISNIRKEVTKGPLTVSRVYNSDFQKEKTITAEFKQLIETVSFYPKAIANDSLTGELFSSEEFNFIEEPHSNSETRVCWVNVPEGNTLETVIARLKTLPNPGLQRVLSNRPILSDSQKHAIKNPELDTTIDTFANRQVIRVPETAEENAGELALDTNSKIQYRRVIFSPNVKEDIDKRTKDTEDFYASEEVLAEMNDEVFFVEGQSL